MVPSSPADVLGSHASAVREVLVEVVRSLHDRSAEAHLASGTRYGMVFASQWRDLLDDAHDALTHRGYPSYKLPPAGYNLPVVNDCLVYVWRVPGAPDAVSKFAASPTRRNGFTAPPPPPMLFDPSFMDGDEQDGEASDDSGLGRALMAVSDTMPVVLVMVQSSPRQLHSIQWGIAAFDEESGKVHVRGQESIWEPEPNIAAEASNVESFDEGTPVGPAVEIQKQEGPHSDA